MDESVRQSPLVVAMWGTETPGWGPTLRVSGVSFVDVCANLPEFFETGYLLISSIDPEVSDLYDLARELDAEGFFAELLGRSALLCSSSGIAVFQDLAPATAELMVLSGPLTLEDYRRLRVRPGYFPRRADVFDALGARMYVAWDDEDRGVVCTRDEALLKETVLFVFQTGVFGEERFLTGKERALILETFYPLVKERGLLLERQEGGEREAVDALAVGWVPDGPRTGGSLPRGLVVPARRIRVGSGGDIDLGPPREVNVLGQLGPWRFLCLEFGVGFSALLASVLTISLATIVVQASRQVFLLVLAIVLVVWRLWARILQQTV